MDAFAICGRLAIPPIRHGLPGPFSSVSRLTTSPTSGPFALYFWKTRFMRAYRLGSPEGIQSLKLVTMPDPNPGPGQVAIAVRACSLNYRDSLLIRVVTPATAPTPSSPFPMAPARWSPSVRVSHGFRWAAASLPTSPAWPRWRRVISVDPRGTMTQSPGSKRRARRRCMYLRLDETSSMSVDFDTPRKQG